MRSERSRAELRGPHRFGGGDFLSLSPLCTLLTRQSSEGGLTPGIFHRLTGKSYELSPIANSLLIELTRGELALDDIEDDGARGFLQRLLSEGFLTSALHPQPLSACGIPMALADWQLHIPLRNPAIALTCPDGTGVLYRNSDLGLCRLPRTHWKPDVLQDSLSRTAIALLRCAQSHTPWRQVEAELLSQSASTSDIRAGLWYLTHSERQMLRWVAPWAHLDQVSAFFQFQCQSFIRSTVSVNDITPAGTHYRDIDDAAENFDWLETTVSHAFRRPTSVLQSESFGERLAGYYLPWLRQRAKVAPLRILEVGGGMGDLAHAFITRIASECAHHGPVSYTILDASPGLQRQQSSLHHTNAYFNFLCGDAQEDLPPGTFDLILCNEVIADMENVRGPDGQLQQRGALQFIEGIARHLSQGGKAYISEYGELDSPPELATHLDHAEYSVQFQPLVARARELGLEAVVWEMSALLQPDLEASALIGQQERYLCLAAALGSRGVSLQNRVYDEAAFRAEFGAAFEGCECLSPLFAPVKEEIHFGPRMSQFKVLELTAGPSLA